MAAHSKRLLNDLALLLLSLFLIAYGNARAQWDLLVLGTSAAGSTFGVGAGVLIALILCTVVWRVRLGTTRLGLLQRNLEPAVRVGLTIGLFVGLCVFAVLVVLGLVTGQARSAADLAPAARVPWGALLWRAALVIWVDTAVPEELAFRGVLLGLLLDERAAGQARSQPSAGFWRTVRDVFAGMRQPAVILSSLPFTLWHVVVVQQDGPSEWYVYAFKFAFIFVGGLYFGSLRLYTGHLVAAIFAHWAIDGSAFIAAKTLAVVATSSP